MRRYSFIVTVFCTVIMLLSCLVLLFQLETVKDTSKNVDN